MTVTIDADACPVTRIAERIAKEYYYSAGCFFASQPRKSPPWNREMMIKKMSAKMMNRNEGTMIRVYFFPEKVPLRMK